VNRAEVSLQQSDGELRIEVSDRGKGLDVAALAWNGGNDLEDGKLQYRSFGLPTIHHRLSLFGGKMDIRSEPGAGTQIAITVPVPNMTTSHLKK
jgi:signal transduction histidine kinase